MCGRFTMQLGPNEAKATFKRYKAMFEIEPRFNVAPTQRVAIVKSNGRSEITAADWGLVPHWSKQAKPTIRPINAKLETLTESRMFRPLLSHKRCLIFADGFFEWQKVGTKKQPMYFRLKSRAPFAFAGLFDTRQDESTSCALITGEPNELVRPIHDRMPMMLDLDEAYAWIADDAMPLEERLSILRPYPAGNMEMLAVSPAVNSVKNDRPELLQAL